MNGSGSCSGSFYCVCETRHFERSFLTLYLVKLCLIISLFNFIKKNLCTFHVLLVSAANLALSFINGAFYHTIAASNYMRGKSVRSRHAWRCADDVLLWYGMNDESSSTCEEHL